MRYFLDTEFISNPWRLQLVSIGIVAEDGREFYAENNDIDWAQASFWVMQNVAPYMTGQAQSLTEIRDAIVAFIGRDSEIEFWAYNGAFDWVCLVWLFGGYVDLPKNWPRRYREIIEYITLKSETHKVDLPLQKGQQHIAISDARWNRDAVKYLDGLTTVVLNP